MLILLYGDDQFRIDERVREIRAQHDPTGLVTSVFTAPDDSIEAVRNACCSPGFFGSTRLVIVYDLVARAQRGHRQPATLPALASELHRGVPESTVLVLVERHLDSAATRALQAAVPGAIVERFTTPRGRDLIAWAVQRARSYGATLDPAVAEQLLESLFPVTWRRPASVGDVPPDLYRLDHELAKLALAAQPDSVVTGTLLAELVASEEAANDWALAGALAAGDEAQAILELERTLARGVQPELVLAQLVSQYEVYAAIASSPGTPPERVARETGLSVDRLRRSRQTTTATSRLAAATALELLRQLDIAAKRGQVDLAAGLPAVLQRLARLAVTLRSASSHARRAPRPNQISS
jgi:DNA polymerase-3 subunit delta